MEKKIQKHLTLNTHNSLLMGLDAIGLTLRKKLNTLQPDTSDYSNQLFDQSYSSYHLNHTYIGLNLAACNLIAAIIEGCFRSVFGSLIKRDYLSLGEMSSQYSGSNKEYKSMTRAYRLANKLSDEIEFNGGWDKLLQAYREYLDVDLNSLLSARTSEAIKGLFTLRNAAAHGTNLVAPIVKINVKSENEYVFKWQSRLQNLSVYVKREFDLELFDALSHPCFSHHFYCKGSELISEFLSRYGPFGKEIERRMKNLKDYEFGRDNHTL
ncbi:hypothetical protein [Alteromonas lipotrueiana]|uniref:hypothetical protein n=1 Tax=Alteromonas lipotrueiana TaxID=2803815 RepID=UPI001C4523B1|nr:hypothetical protein [Alteromonas lipotrueiana]